MIHPAQPYLEDLGAKFEPGIAQILLEEIEQGVKKLNSKLVRFVWNIEDIEFEGEKFNPRHGAGGRFAPGGGGAAGAIQPGNGMWGAAYQDQIDLDAAEERAVEVYTWSGYARINGGLRKAPDEISVGNKNHIRNLNSAIAKGKPTDIDVIGFRGVGGPVAAQMKPGTVFADKGFVSTSFSHSVAESFAPSGGRAGTGKVLEIHIPKGSRGVYVGRVVPARSEMEFLLPRNARFRIDGTSERGNVVAKYLGSQPGALKEIAL
jgi:hypothetical protein